MKRTRHSAEQVVTKLREADAMLVAGRAIAQVVQALGVSEQTFHRWRNQYGGMKADEARRLKELQVENTRLKKLVADQALDMAILKEANSYLRKHQRGGARREGGASSSMSKNNCTRPIPACRSVACAPCSTRRVRRSGTWQCRATATST